VWRRSRFGKSACHQPASRILATRIPVPRARLKRPKGAQSQPYSDQNDKPESSHLSSLRRARHSEHQAEWHEEGQVLTQGQKRDTRMPRGRCRQLRQWLCHPRDRVMFARIFVFALYCLNSHEVAHQIHFRGNESSRQSLSTTWC